MAYGADRKVERPMVLRKPRKARRNDRQAVVSAVARNDLLFRLPPQNVVDVPGDLYLGFVRIRTLEAPKNTAHSVRRQPKHPIRQPDDWLARMARMAVVVRHLERLVAQGFGDLFAPISDIHAPKRRERIDELATMLVPNADSIGARDDRGIAEFFAGESAEVSVRMQNRLAVDFLERLIVSRRPR